MIKRDYRSKTRFLYYTVISDALLRYDVIMIIGIIYIGGYKRAKRKDDDYIMTG